MKYISPVEINIRKLGSSKLPISEITYGCLVSTNNPQEIESELDDAVMVAEGVTWTIDNKASIWQGALYGNDPDQINLVRNYLIKVKGWRPKELSEFESTGYM